MNLRQLFFPLLGLEVQQTPPDDHHLRRKPSGYFQMRVTIDRGPKYVGDRVILGLKTRSTEEARERRDLILEAYKAAGVAVNHRIKTRKEEA